MAGKDEVADGGGERGQKSKYLSQAEGGILDTDDGYQPITDGAAAVFRNTMAEFAAGVFTTQFWYSSSGSVPPCAEISGGDMTRVVAVKTSMTRKVFSWPVSSLVMWCTALTVAMVKQSPAALNGSTSGAGAAGGDGVVVVISF